MSNRESTGFLANLQVRNQRNLVETLKAAEPVIEEIAKVKPESWRNMRGLFTALEGTFGISQIAGGALKPLSMVRNRASNVLEGLLAPLMVGINDVSNKVEAFALSNQRGAIGGAIAGGVLGAFMGHPALGALFGSLVGAGLQSIVGNLPQEGPGYYPYDPDIIDQFPADPIEDIANRTRNWVNYQAGFAANLNPISRNYLINNARFVNRANPTGLLGRRGGR